MKPMIEVNRLSLLMDQRGRPEASKFLFNISGNLPVLQTPYEINLVEYSWHKSDRPDGTAELRIQLEGMAQDPRWKLDFKADVRLGIKWSDQVVRWGTSAPFELVLFDLSDGSQVFIDEREVDLVPTINQVLSDKGRRPEIINYAWLNSKIEDLSRTYFGSELLPELLENLYYLVRGKFDPDSCLLSLSAAHQQDHFSQIDQAPPYLFLKLPTQDIEYFVRHFDWPDIDVKGYLLQVQSLEVKDDHLLVVQVKESEHDWLFKVGLSLTLTNNTIIPEVQFIRSEGLGFVTKTLFKLFKGTVKRQIEGRPIDVAAVYENQMNHFRTKYPFIQVQPEDRMYVDALSFQKKQIELMIHFEKNSTGDSV